MNDDLLIFMTRVGGVCGWCGLRVWMIVVERLRGLGGKDRWEGEGRGGCNGGYGGVFKRIFLGRGERGKIYRLVIFARESPPLPTPLSIYNISTSVKL